MIFITAISAGPLLARARQCGIPHGVYVYSWDHACKHPSFSREVTRYWVWNQGIVQDLAELQALKASAARIVGSTQLSYVRDYCAQRRARPPDQPHYVYYGCGVGHPGMATQEIALVHWLAEELRTVAPEVRLLVRPYPMLADTEIFASVRRLPNVDIDESFRLNQNDRSLSRDQIMTKLALQDGAITFVHCGTTMGFEGAYLDTPIIFLAPDDFDYGVRDVDFFHLRKFIGQYHNIKYMIEVPGRNVVRRVQDLAPLLRAVLANPAGFLDYNRAIRSVTPLRSLEEIAQTMLIDLLPENSR